MNTHRKSRQVLASKNKKSCPLFGSGQLESNIFNNLFVAAKEAVSVGGLDYGYKKSLCEAVWSWIVGYKKSLLAAVAVRRRNFNVGPGLRSHA